ncbi:Putative disease resistance protein RGA3 [Morus notabilis]|uniref:Putative disease resistance protein RGA3 n=1 Tax=Morus notabilis TaxID=981085 RepID=W9QGH6_9ROSA|nr:Putative disease resistance protein RGA3 [Morus notabilis]
MALNLEPIIAEEEFLDLQSKSQLTKPYISRSSRLVCNLLSLPKGLVFRHKVAHRIKAIRRRLAKIGEDKNHFDLQHSNDSEESTVPNRSERETHSYVNEEEVTGREKEKKEILELLSLGAESETSHEDLSVIPIVGIGGLGKTTLAKQVYNDPRVIKHFELRIWVYVSEDFNVRSIVEKIIKSEDQTLAQGLHEMQQLQRKLREEILNGKRYLLVLDDVWNEDPMKWGELETLLRNNGKGGNKILLTTRNEDVSKITSRMEPYCLHSLDGDNSWDLFKRIAFVQVEDLIDNHKVSIGREIVKKCHGIPLAIKSVASLLRANPEIDHWLSFKDKLSSISEDSQGHGHILQTLRLSYEFLPSATKRCFAFLSLYPKGYEIDKIMSIDHWLAQGFITSTSNSSHEPIEEAALRCFEGLVSRSFLEYDQGYHGQYKMHDLVHDLAVWVGGKRYAILSNDEATIDERSTRYVSLQLNNLRPSFTSQIRSSLVQAKMIQSIIIPTESNFAIVDRRFEPSFYKEMLSKFKFLRSLDLHNSGIEIVPESIAKLKHLRTLDLSRNVELKTLPDSISKLLNLQSLNLSSCFSLEELPRGVSQLVNLRNLRLDYCHCLTHLPSGLGQLSNLQTLSRLVLSEDSQSAKVEDLRNLNSLRGGLEIRNLKHGMDIEVANFGEKRYLQSLSLFWGHDVAMDAIGHERTLRGTQYIPSLKDFTLNGYGGVCLSSWFPFTKLVLLKLEMMPALEYVTGSSCERSRQSMIMPSLKELRLTNLPNLKGWWREMDKGNEDDSDLFMLPCFPQLGSLYICHCPRLTCMPLFPFLDWELQLRNTSWKLLLKTIKQKQINPQMDEMSASSSTSTFCASLSKVQRVILSKNDDLEFFPDYLRNLTSMWYLKIEEFPRLKSLSPGVQYFVSLIELHIGSCEMVDLCDDSVWQSLRRLTHLSLRELPQLVDLPDGLQHVTTL